MALFEVQKQSVSALKDRFGTNPFSVLRADTGEWIKQKRQWEEIIHDVADNVRNTTAKGNTPYINNFEKEDFKGAKSPNAGMISTFDPFLCELLIKWFSEEGALILDPFAGGVVRGAVSALLNRYYIGFDINELQVKHNFKQWKEIEEKYNTEAEPFWATGDADELLDNLIDSYYNLVLTCPPYYNLERYTDNAEDLSNKSTYKEFIDKYTAIIKKCSNKLKNGGYCILVVEEIRDKNGNFYGFVPDTIRVCQEAGLNYYNEMILMNPIASLGIRSTKYFVTSRKVGRHHQNVLVFKK